MRTRMIPAASIVKVTLRKLFDRLPVRENPGARRSISIGDMAEHSATLGAAINALDVGDFEVIAIELGSHQVLMQHNLTLAYNRHDHAFDLIPERKITTIPGL